jgi:hypothetical protein
MVALFKTASCCTRQVKQPEIAKGKLTLQLLKMGG